MSFEAKYRGVCADCGSRIEPGQTVEYDEEDELVHTDCVPTGPVRSAPPCERCWLVHAGECM